MNIRPMDLQVMIPRTMDAAKVATVTDQQSATHQQQLAGHLKQVTAQQQQQVQLSKQAQHEGKVSTDDLGKEKQGKQQKQREEQTEPDLSETLVEKFVLRPIPPDPLRGSKIDIKT